MGRYIEWDDVIDRYPELNTLGGADELEPSYIAFAEAAVDGLLSNHFTTPFSSNNMVVKDLSIDHVYWRTGRFKFEDATIVKSSFFVTINMLNKGQLVMIDDDGDVISGVKKQLGLISSTQSYHSSFGMLDVVEQHIDEDNITDERAWE